MDASPAIILPDCGMFIGSPIYLDRGDYVFQTTGPYYTSWVSEDHEPEWYLQKIVDDNQGNLAIIWDGSATKRSLKAMAHWLALPELELRVPEPDWENRANLLPEDWAPTTIATTEHAERYGLGFLRLVQRASALGLHSYSMYADAQPQWVEHIVGHNGFIGYNTGEKFTLDLPGGEASDHRLGEEGEDAVQDLANLEGVVAAFVNKVRLFFDSKRQAGWRRFLITSASFNLDVELAAAGGDVVPHIEAFAFPSLNFAAALCRGMTKQLDLPLWGLYLAHEHYSYLPYGSPHKFPMLEAAFRLSYMSGAKISVLESGNWWQQTDHVDDTPMHQTPKIDLGSIHRNDPRAYAHLVPEARRHFPLLGYDSATCRSYRRVLSEFYDFVKETGTPPGQPEVLLAAIKGRNDLCGPQFHPNAVVAGAYAQAETDHRWYEGMPERSWELFRGLFYPLRHTLGGHVNSFLSGTPYGMTDIVSLGATVSAEFLLANYRALLFTGWNTATDAQYQTLKAYVHGGGTLFAALPHFARNTTRNYVSYSPDCLINGGDLGELCGIKVKRRGTPFYWMLAAEGNRLGLPTHKHFGPCLTHLGDIDLVGTPEILAVHDESFAPALLLNHYGRGKVYTLNTWEYPGAMDRHSGPGAEVGSGGLIVEVYAHIARECRGSVFLTHDGIDSGGDCAYIVYAHFPSNGNIYLLNIDFSHERSVRVHHHGSHTQVALAPLEFRILDAGTPTP